MENLKENIHMRSDFKCVITFATLCISHLCFLHNLSPLIPSHHSNVFIYWSSSTPFFINAPCTTSILLTLSLHVSLLPGVIKLSTCFAICYLPFFGRVRNVLTILFLYYMKLKFLYPFF